MRKDLDAHFYQACTCKRPDGRRYGPWAAEWRGKPDKEAAACPRLRSSSKHGTWYAYVNIPKTSTQPRRRERKGGFATKADAQVWAGRFQSAAHQGQRVTSARETLATYLPTWLDRRAGGRRPLSAATLDTYRVYAGVVSKHPIAKVPMIELTYPDLQGFIDEIAELRGAASVDKIATLLQSALKTARKEGLTVGMPAAGLELPPTGGERRVILDAAQTARALRALAENSSTIGNLAEIALFTGMRVGEIVGLRWEDIDGDVLTVRQTLVSVRGHISVGSGKTAAARRQIALGPLALKTLGRQRAVQNRARLRAGAAWADQGLVFTTEIGGPIDPKYPTKRLVEIERREELPRMTMHGFRHLHVTHLDQVGMPRLVVKQRVGHSAAGDVTEGVYTHRSVDAQREHVAAAERIVGDMLSNQGRILSNQPAASGTKKTRNLARSA